ncbi:hypothetical protein TSAR_005773 [Trichomalopsis sarcophagae]|uniref:Uncharacterized protein n=1 Tax=Trichomalopsis sarcophagae TaxID=543379 RepID=A0A232EXS0_9HYME|nr:hypothetical protein TSAR_005773 [Trichomalopsis sarcophagae]
MELFRSAIPGSEDSFANKKIFVLYNKKAEIKYDPWTKQARGRNPENKSSMSYELQQNYPIRVRPLSRIPSTVLFG